MQISELEFKQKVLHPFYDYLDREPKKPWSRTRPTELLGIFERHFASRNWNQSLRPYFEYRIACQHYATATDSESLEKSQRKAVSLWDKAMNDPACPSFLKAKAVYGLGVCYQRQNEFKKANYYFTKVLVLPGDTGWKERALSRKKECESALEAEREKAKTLLQTELQTAKATVSSLKEQLTELQEDKRGLEEAFKSQQLLYEESQMKLLEGQTIEQHPLLQQAELELQEEFQAELEEREREIVEVATVRIVSDGQLAQQKMEQLSSQMAVLKQELNAREGEIAKVKRAYKRLQQTNAKLNDTLKLHEYTEQMRERELSKLRSENLQHQEEIRQLQRRLCELKGNHCTVKEEPLLCDEVLSI